MTEKDERTKTPAIEWEEEGDGWVGRWRSRGYYGAMGALVLEPEGGLHGGWAWSHPWARGTHPDVDVSTALCEATFLAAWRVMSNDD